MQIEYRVRPVTRFVVTKCTQDEDRSGSVGTCGEYDNADVAYDVGYALAKADADRFGLPPGDASVMFPARLDLAEVSGGLRTVGALREALAALPDDAVPMTPEPPFTGVKLVPQNSGKVLICPCDEYPTRGTAKQAA